MPKATRKSVREQSPPSSDGHNSTDSVEDTDSDHNQDPDVSFCPVAPPNQVPACICHILRTQDEFDS